MVNLYFMRWKNRRRPYGYISAKPFNDHRKCAFVDPFFIVQIDETTIPEGLIGNKSVRLNLDVLQAKDEYQDIVETYTDEEGVEYERVVYGYFSEHGRSNAENPPVITMSEVLYE